jgi:superfamily II DNA helicase RecQ
MNSSDLVETICGHLDVLYGTTEFKDSVIEAAIMRACNGQSSIVCAPTGSGKSSIAEVLARQFSGQVVVLVPAAAIVSDKVDRITAANSVQSAGAVRGGSRQDGHTDLIFLTFESFANPTSRGIIDANIENIVAIVVDEAHALYYASMFRDAMLQTLALLDSYQQPLVFMSATLPKDAVSFIARHCPRVKEDDLLRSDQFRNNLQYNVVSFNSQSSVTRSAVATIMNFLEISDSSKAIVFCSTIEACDKMADEIGKESVVYYSTATDKDANLAKFTASSGCRVMIGTTAVAAGVNTGGVTLVVIAGMLNEPSIAILNQACGRGGREVGSTCRCEILVNIQAASRHPGAGDTVRFVCMYLG